MSKIMFLILLFIGSSVSANCFTGAACSIDKLFKQQSNINAELHNKIQNYFSREIVFSAFPIRNNSSFNYNDLFLFNTIV